MAARCFSTSSASFRSISSQSSYERSRRNASSPSAPRRGSISTRESIERLIRYDWPGNVRELKNVVSVAVALAESGGPIDLAAPLGGATDDSGSPAAEKLGYHAAKRAALDRFERAYFSALIEETGGNIAEISRIAGLQRTHVRRYVKAHALKRKG